MLVNYVGAKNETGILERSICTKILTSLRAKHKPFEKLSQWPEFNYANGIALVLANIITHNSFEFNHLVIIHSLITEALCWAILLTQFV